MDKKRWLEVGVVCILFLLLAAYAEASGKKLRDHHVLEREAEGGQDRSVSLILNAGDLLKDYEYRLTVPASGISSQQAEKYFEQARKEIDDSFFAEGEMPDHVTKDVHMKNSYAEGLVKAEWLLDQSDVVDADGNIISDEIPEEGIPVQASAKLRCGEEQEEYVFSFMVCPPSLTDREQLLKDIQQTLVKEGEKKGTKTFSLPEKIDGVRLKWNQKKEHTVLKVLFFEIVIVILLRLAILERKRTGEKMRKEQMELDYSEMVNKLLILLGSGMSLKQSWNRISTQYLDKRKKKQVPERAVYEEMLTTNYEICDGESERLAYEKFGERTGLGSYQRLVRILIQNLQTGSRGLCTLLGQEAADALEERKALAKKLGEEAGTKMLLPLILMLGIVIAIIMVPAMLSFNV